MKHALPVAVLLLLAVLWEMAVRFFQMPSYILPAPSNVCLTIARQPGLLLHHALVTLAELGLGFFLALIAGLGLGALIHLSAVIARVVLPLAVASQAIPVFAIAPLLVLWFGYGLGSKVLMTALIVFFPMVINTARGLDAANPDMLALFRTMGASPRQIFFKVRIPYALPSILTGIKIGVSVSVIGAVIGEWVGSKAGLGYLLVQANARFRTDLVFAAILILSVIGTALYGLVVWLEKHITPRGL